MGELKYFLGLQVKQSRDDIFLSQEKYIKKLLKIFDMDRLKAKITPMSPLTKVTQDKNKFPSMRKGTDIGKVVFFILQHLVLLCFLYVYVHDLRLIRKNHM